MHKFSIKLNGTGSRSMIDNLGLEHMNMHYIKKLQSFGLSYVIFEFCT